MCVVFLALVSEPWDRTSHHLYHELSYYMRHVLACLPEKQHKILQYNTLPLLTKCKIKDYRFRPFVMWIWFSLVHIKLLFSFAKQENSSQFWPQFWSCCVSVVLPFVLLNIPCRRWNYLLVLIHLEKDIYCEHFVIATIIFQVNKCNGIKNFQSDFKSQIKINHINVLKLVPNWLIFHMFDEWPLMLIFPSLFHLHL